MHISYKIQNKPRVVHEPYDTLDAAVLGATALIESEPNLHDIVIKDGKIMLFKASRIAGRLVASKRLETEWVTKGDIFETSCEVIAHGCNALGVMGSGIAAVIRNMYPGLFEKYVEELNHLRLMGRDPLGTFSTYYDPYHGKPFCIINAITQLTVRSEEVPRPVNYWGIAQAFISIREFLNEKEIDEIAIPKIGAGLGGGDWEIIIGIINLVMRSKTVHVYEL